MTDNNIDQGIDQEQEVGQDYGQVFFEWDFPEFEDHNRTQSWYIMVSVIVVGILIYSVLSTNYIFALLTIISALLVILLRRTSRIINFKITEDGFIVDGKFYDYNRVKDFYIIYQPPEIKKLYIEMKSVFVPRIPIYLEDQDPVKIREVLLKYIEEDTEKEHEPISDQIARILKL
jgi:hypothetical protein